MKILFLLFFVQIFFSKNANACNVQDSSRCEGSTLGASSVTRYFYDATVIKAKKLRGISNLSGLKIGKRQNFSVSTPVV